MKPNPTPEEEGKVYTTKTDTTSTGFETVTVYRVLGPGETIPALIQPADPEDPESVDVELRPALGEGACVRDVTCSGSHTVSSTMTSTPLEGYENYEAYIHTEITTTLSGSGTYDDEGYLRQGDGCSYVYSGSGNSSATLTCYDDNDEPYTCTVSNSMTVNPETGDQEWGGGYCHPCYGSDCVPVPAAVWALWECSIFGGYFRGVDVSYEETHDPPLGEDTVQFSIEAPDCEADLPEYPAWPNEPPTPYVYGQGSESTALYLRSGEYVSRQKIKYRFKFNAPGTCYLKVWVRVTTTLYEGEDAPTYEDVEYEWQGSGTPCLPDKTKPFYSDENIVYSEPIEIPVPDIKSSISVSLLKYSYIKGYEPDITDPDNKQPNGFPDPEWEPAN